MEYSPTESNRFGLKVYRHSGMSVPKGLDEQIVSEGVDVLFLRVDMATPGWQQAVEKLGFPHVVADSLVHYRRPIEEDAQPLRNDGIDLLEVRTQDLAAREQLAELIREIFPGYTNHYSANPFLPAAGILDGYCEWADSYVLQPDRGAYLVMLDGGPVGFATCAFEEDSIEGVLYGVRPGVAGGGVYGDIMSLTYDLGLRMGKHEMHVSTQLQNIAVQRAWVRRGFRVADAEATVHINSLLSVSAGAEGPVWEPMPGTSLPEIAQLACVKALDNQPIIELRVVAVGDGAISYEGSDTRVRRAGTGTRGRVAVVDIRDLGRKPIGFAYATY